MRQQNVLPVKEFRLKACMPASNLTLANKFLPIMGHKAGDVGCSKFFGEWQR